MPKKLLDATIYDADPNSAGPPEGSMDPWDMDDTPDFHSRADIVAWARAEARKCGEYEPGDRLWCYVWREDGLCIEDEFSIRV